MSMIFSQVGKGLKGASAAEMSASKEPGPQLAANPVQVSAPQQMQVQPVRQQNLSDAVQNLNVANQLAQQQQNKSIEAKVNTEAENRPWQVQIGNGSPSYLAQQGDAAAAAGRTAYTAGQFAGPGNAAQAGAAAGEAAHLAGSAPNSLGVSASQLANTQALVQQDTRDEQAAQERNQLGINPQQQQQMDETAQQVNAGAYTPPNLYQSSLAFR
jgi:hypothetical protein